LQGGHGHSDKHYKQLSFGQLGKRPIGQIADYVFLWSTVAHVERGYELIRTWGFKPVTMLFWLKATSLVSGEPSNALGFNPYYGIGYWFRGAVEPIIVAKSPRAPVIHTQYLGLITPNLQHSRKPESLHKLIEAHYPPPHIELFARRQRRHWFCFGNELSGVGYQG
jgi:N6-adenosine-specific RNA methylase IME4